jgi:hypothetical protein
MFLRDAIVTVLEEAGAKGLHMKEIAELIKERKLRDWKDVKEPVDSIRNSCHSNPGTFTKVARGTYALHTTYAKPTMSLREAIVTVLEEAGAKGLHTKEIAELIKERKLRDWKGVKRPIESVRPACINNPGIFVRVARGTYALRSGVNGTNGTRKASKSKGRSPRPLPKPGRPRKWKKVDDCIINVKPYKHAIQVTEEGRIVLFSKEYQESLQCIWI